jgi:signal transduction histidine kinase
MSRLYTKIFLSFLAILIVTEILIFGLFIFFAGRHFRDRFEQYTTSQITFVKEFVEDKINARPSTPPSQNQALKALILRMGKIYDARFWLTGPDGRPLAKSFEGKIPKDVEKQPCSGPIGITGPFKIYKDFGKNHKVYVVVPIQMLHGQSGNLHALFESMNPERHRGPFALGLLVIGLFIALLVVPVSRRITKRLNRLRESADRISKGDLSHRSSVHGKDEIGQLASTFNTMAEKLERMIRGGKELTANVSHELRSPLARIRVAEEIMRGQLKKGIPKGMEKHLNNIQEDVYELDRLIGRILEFSKLDLHEESFEKGSLDLSAILRKLLARYEPVMGKKEVALEMEMPETVSMTGEKRALESAFTNLLDNAFKFVHEGGRVAVRLIRMPDHLELRVSNTYGKLADEELENLFEPFYRVTDVKEAGTGLGLAIAKKIIERNGGRIQAANAENGIEFVIRFRPS